MKVPIKMIKVVGHVSDAYRPVKYVVPDVPDIPDVEVTSRLTNKSDDEIREDDAQHSDKLESSTVQGNSFEAMWVTVPRAPKKVCN